MRENLYNTSAALDLSAGLDPPPKKMTMDSHLRGNDMQRDYSAFCDYFRELLYAAAAIAKRIWFLHYRASRKVYRNETRRASGG
ncbi:MAG: hypothetical protein ACPL7J_08560 [Desulfomonilaceae bacterium]